jgi:hypothetical protein
MLAAASEAGNRRQERSLVIQAVAELEFESSVRVSQSLKTVWAAAARDGRLDRSAL